MNSQGSANEEITEDLFIPDATTSLADDQGELTEPQVKRNMFFCIMLDSIYITGWTDFTMALMPLLVFLKATNTIIGIATGATLFALIGGFVTPWISRRFRIKKWYLIAVNVPQIGAIGVAGLIIILSHQVGLSDPGLLKFVFVAIVAHQFFSGFVALPHQEYVAACIPMSHRGRLAGLSTSLGALLGIGSSAIGGLILLHYAKPMAFGYLFLMTWVICQGGYFLAAFAKERPTPVEKSPRPWSKDMLRITWNDKPYVRFMAVYMLGIVTFAVPGYFVQVYGFRELKMIPATAAVIAIISLIVRASGSMPMGFLVDRLGPKRLVPLWPIGHILVYGIILLFPNQYGIYIGGAVCQLLALGSNTAISVMLYGLPKPEHRAGHYTIQAILTSISLAIAPILGGWMCDLMGYRATFAVGVFMGLAFLPFMKYMLAPLSNDTRSYS